MNKIFKKRDEEDIHEKNRKLTKEITDKIINNISFADIQKDAKKNPGNPFFQNIKSKEEFKERMEVMRLAGLMALGSINFVEACKEIIKHADKGLKINPNSAYLLYFRGRSKGDLGQLKEGLEDLNKCLKIKPDYAEAYVERGYIKQKMGDISGAKKDYESGVSLDPSLQQQVNSYLNKGNDMNKDSDMVIPFGVTFKIIVTPSLTENHQKGLRYVIIKNSGLGQYFKNIWLVFTDGYKGNDAIDDKLKGKQMLVEVFCPEPIVAVKKDKEKEFYNQLKTKFSEWIIEVIQTNTERKYKAKLEDFLLTRRILP